METLNFNLTNDIFDEFSLSAEEMINIRGGENEPVSLPTLPPVKI